MAPKNKHDTTANKIIRGLATVVGLEESASIVEVLRCVAETLGCTVQEDGTTTIEDDEEEQGPSAKRAKVAAGPGGAEGNDSDGELGEAQEDSEAEEQQEEEVSLEVEPVMVEDLRTADEVKKQEEIVNGEELFQWLISPVDVEHFEETLEEQHPLLVSRPNNRRYYDSLFSKAEIDRLLRAKGLQYVYNIDVVSYSKSGRRENFNYNGKEEPAEGQLPDQADAKVVWRRFEKEACSIRILHPQRYSDALWRVLARLEGFLQCCVGCNAYLTPAGSQGFAPHWDDIDAYVLQLEGKKRWRLHAPTDPSHVLPRYSSCDFVQEELGECVLDQVLEPGDLLYMPRGTVHQAEALPDTHSLHLTISTNQLRTWADFLGQALPRAVQLAAQEHVALRRSLPRETYNIMGIMHELSDDDEEEWPGAAEEESEEAALRQMREGFRQQALDCMKAVAHCLPLDSTADHMAVQFLQSRLPPITAGPSSSSKRAAPCLSPSSRVRVVQPGIARLVVEDGEGGDSAAVVYHCLSNSRQQHASRPANAAATEVGEEGPKQESGVAQHRAGKAPVEEESEGEEAGPLEFPIECAAALEALLKSRAGTEVAVGELPPVEGCDIDAIGVAQVLADMGILEVLQD